MGFALVSGQSAANSVEGGTTVTVSLPNNPTTGSVVCVAARYYGGTGTTITSVLDGNSNAYAVASNNPSTYNNAGQIFLAYLLSAPANAHKTITITFAAANTEAAAWADEFSVSGGVAVLDMDAKGTGSGSTINTPTVTVTSTNELMYSAVAPESFIETANSPWTGNAGGSKFGCWAAYIADRSVDTALNFSQSDAVGWTSMGMSFKAVVTVALSGTVTGSITEANIVTGGKTVILTATGDTFVPAAGTKDIEYVSNALGATDSTTTFSITLPTTTAGDILILEFAHRGTGDGTISGTSVTTDGLTWTLKKKQLFASSAYSGQTWWTRATGDHAGKTVTGADLTNSCAAIVTVYRGALASGDPLDDAAIVGEENASGNETQAEISNATAGAVIVLVVVNSPDYNVSSGACTTPGALTERAERLSTGGTDTSVSHWSARKTTAGATGAFTWSQTNSASGSWAYAIKPAATTPFADARQAIINGLDSAQSEGAGWDAVVKAGQAVTGVVRTSGTVCTITLDAFAGYNITAQETVTATVPASALVGGVAVVASPTFTIAAGGPVNVATWDDLAKASIATINGLAIASVATVDGLA